MFKVRRCVLRSGLASINCIYEGMVCEHDSDFFYKVDQKYLDPYSFRGYEHEKFVDT